MNHTHGKDPSAMAGMFGRMSDHSAHGMFTVRRLDMTGRKVEMPAPPIRSEIHCFFFVTAGEALITIGEDSYFFKANECATIPAGQTFAVRYFDNCTGYMGGFHTEYLNCGNDGRNLLGAFGFLRRWGSHKVMFDTQHARYIEEIFRRLEIEHSGSRNDKIIRAYLTTLLTEIEEASTPSRVQSDTENETCNDFIEMVFERPSHSITITDYASRLNVSKDHLHRVVKRFTGKTPLEWVTEAVVLEAKVLLRHTRMSVGEISAKVGVDDPSYFSRLFKKQTGITPLQYRENSKNP